MKAPKLALRLTQGQRPLGRRAILLRAGCPSEACVLAASGSLRPAGQKRVYKLASKPRRLAKGRTAVLSLKLSKSLRRALRRAFEERGKASARLTVRAVDLAGNVTKKRVSLKLEGLAELRLLPLGQEVRQAGARRGRGTRRRASRGTT